MAVLRTEKQVYADLATIVAETLVPKSNDIIFVTSLKRGYDWVEDSTDAHDGVYVIEQTSVPTGRWIVSKAYTTYTGTGDSIVMENGQMYPVDITVTGATPAVPSLIALTNADTLPTNVFVVSKTIVATDTVRVILKNQSCTQVPVTTLDVTVITFDDQPAPVTTTAPVMGGAGTSTSTDIGPLGATLTAEFTSDGGSPITTTGFNIALASAPATIVSTVSSATLTSPFSATATDLTASTAYIATPYATNAVGTTNGEAVNFSTTAVVPAGGLTPIFLTADNSGNIFTSNNGSANVTKITPSGVASIIGSTGSNAFCTVTDSAGNVYVSNYTSNTVTKITPSLVVTTITGVGTNPYGITVDSSDNVYVAGNGSNSISKITPAGVVSTYVTLIAKPQEIAMDSVGNIWSVSFTGGSVTKIDPTLTKTVYAVGANPYGIGIDSSDNAYVSVSSASQVKKITPAGVITVLGSTGSGARSVTVDSNDNIYVSNNGANSVKKFTPTGVATTITGTGVGPWGLVSDNSGNVYVGHSGSNSISKINSSGTITHPFALT